MKPPHTSEETYITLAAAAQTLDQNLTDVMEAAESGELPSVEVAGRVFVKVDDQ